MKFSIWDGQRKVGTITVVAGQVTATDDGICRCMKGWVQESVREWSDKNGWTIKRER